MIALAVRFLNGRYHATPWGEHVNSGSVEWPPSPWRIVRSIVAAALRVPGAADPTTLSSVVTKLAGAPPLFYAPAVTVGHWRTYAKSLAHTADNPGKDTNLVHDTFVILPSPDASLYVVWPDVQLDDVELAWLATVVRRVGYLGRSESVCEVSMFTSPPEVAGLHCLAPQADGGGGSTLVLVPSPNVRLADIVLTTEELRRDQRRAVPPGARFVGYDRPVGAMGETVALPRQDVPTTPGGVGTVLFRLSGSLLPSVWQTGVVGATMRRAAQAQFGRYHAQQVSAMLSGHENGGRRQGHDHAHYLPLALDGDRQRVDHLLVWTPGGLSSDEVAALCRVTRLVFPPYLEMPPVGVMVLGFGGGTSVTGWRGRNWVSHTPLAPSRHPHLRRHPDGNGYVIRDGPSDEVRLELTRRGLPAPRSVTVVPRPQWLRYLAPDGRGMVDTMPLGFRIEFDADVDGPICLGRWAHVGLGLFGPEQ